VRELGRPALLTLRDARGQPSWLVLAALDEHGATLQAGAVTLTVVPAALAGVWRGEIATFWRTPPGWRDPWPDTPPAALAAWMAERLPGTPEQPLKARVTAFQVAQGLKPDGVAGPLTLMQMSRASGVDEPRLEP
jgi:general secretion pathway protein A